MNCSMPSIEASRCFSFYPNSHISHFSFICHVVPKIGYFVFSNLIRTLGLFGTGDWDLTFKWCLKLLQI